MESAVICLAVACGVLGLSTATLGGLVPFILWRLWKAEDSITKLDTALAELLALLHGGKPK